MAKRLLIWAGVLAVVAVFVFALRAFVYIPLPDPGASDIHAETRLPDAIQVCGRSWERGNHEFTSAQLAALNVLPPLVDTQLLAACPKGACGIAQSAPCSSMVVVRVREDAYTDYSLVGSR